MESGLVELVGIVERVLGTECSGFLVGDLPEYGLLLEWSSVGDAFLDRDADPPRES